MLGTYHLTVLYDVLKDLHFLYHTERIYPYLLENLVKALESEAASLFIADPAKKNLTLTASLGPKKNMFEMIASELPFAFGKGVCGWVAQYNQPLIVEDAQKDARFNPQVDTLTGFKTRSILCAPLSYKDEVLGVIEILNKKGAAFNKNDLDLVTIIAKQSAIALQNARLYTDLQASRDFNESVLANLTGGFLAVDAKWVVTHLNAQAERILQLAAGDAIGKSCSDALKAYPSVYKEVVDALTTKERKIRQELECERPDRSKIRIGYSTFLICDQEKSFLGAGMLFQDLTQFERSSS